MKPAIWLIIVCVIGSVLIGAAAYNAGVSHGAAQAAIAAGSAATQAPYAMAPWGWHRPWGVGFAFPFFLLFFWVLAARMLWCGGPWRHRYYASAHGGVPPMFDEWHRRLHERDRSDGGTPHA
jgi:hypothetical protein